MNRLLSVLIILFAANVYSQDTIVKKRCNDQIIVEIYNSDDQLIVRGRLKLYKNVQIQTGSTSNVPVTEYFKEGKWKVFYDNGNKKSVKIYMRGELISVKKRWDVDGNRIQDRSEPKNSH